MHILSSYYLDAANNERIANEAERLGWTFTPATDFDLKKRIALVEEKIHTADIFLGGRLTDDQWRRATRLQWIHVPWAGVNSLLAVDGIRQSDITISNSSGVMSDAVADQTIAYMLMMARDLPVQIRTQPERTWINYSVQDGRRRLLRGATLGIAGYGAIGRALAARARAFGMRVVASKRDVSSTPPDLDAVYADDDIADMVAASDYLVIALPLTDRTRGLFDRRMIERMKPSAYLINIARGEVVVEEDLVEALQSNMIAGAALDVFRKEPLPEDSPLWGLENVIVTPHSAGGFVGFAEAVTDLFLENMRRYKAGVALVNPVRQKEGY
jgi:phosphoglycerate dehydrogenase-like enzyme